MFSKKYLIMIGLQDDDNQGNVRFYISCCKATKHRAGKIKPDDAFVMAMSDQETDELSIQVYKL